MKMFNYRNGIKVIFELNVFYKTVENPNMMELAK